MSDKSDILDEMLELANLATDLSDRIGALRDKIDCDELMVATDRADEIALGLEGDDGDNPYDATDDETENAAWSEGWQACIDRIRAEYGS